MFLRPLVLGLATYVPGLRGLVLRHRGSTLDPRYCYSVWLRHLVMTLDAGARRYPRVVAELGPGSSLGIGLAALIGGAERYFAFDVVRLAADREANLAVFDALVQLFKDRTPIPGQDEYPTVHPRLASYEFPHELVPAAAFDTERLARLRESLDTIEYVAPWSDPALIDPGSVDMIFSQAVLEHVDDLAATYAAMHSWLRAGGVMSHQIDYQCHDTAWRWNGHWQHSDRMWSLMRGRHRYFLNREPHSRHLRLLRESGFEVISTQTVPRHSQLTVGDLAPRFRELTSDDLVTSGAFIRARKVHA
jgi:SAM-dependent methyltransferase